MTDTDVLVAILNYHPDDDPTDLLSRAYNEIERLRGDLDSLRRSLTHESDGF